MEFSNRVAVVTGGGRGLGRDIALAFAEAGADVVIVGRDEAALRGTASEIEASGRRCLAVAVDLTAQDSSETLASHVGNAFGHVDIVVTAAGIRDHANQVVAEMDPARFDEVLRGNVMSTVLPIRALLPGMIARRYGKIITLSGVFGIRGRARHSAGSSAKWAIEGFVRSLALEAGPHNINVNSVCPGYVEGERAAEGMAKVAAGRGISTAEVKAELESVTALKRLSAPADIANAVLFLASDRARNITGQDLVVDAGWTL